MAEQTNHNSATVNFNAPEREVWYGYAVDGGGYGGGTTTDSHDRHEAHARLGDNWRMSPTATGVYHEAERALDWRALTVLAFACIGLPAAVGLFVGMALLALAVVQALMVAAALGAIGGTCLLAARGLGALVEIWWTARENQRDREQEWRLRRLEVATLTIRRFQPDATPQLPAPSPTPLLGEVIDAETFVPAARHAPDAGRRGPVR